MAWPGMFKKLFANDGAGPFLRGDILPVMTSSASGIGRPDGISMTVDASGKFSVASVPAEFTRGMIIMWSGAIATVPSGWALCNGVNGTPNLIDRFIVAAGSSYAVGATGGAASVTPAGTVANTTLTVAQMPAHNHNLKFDNNAKAEGGGAWIIGAGTYNYSDFHINYTGGSGAHTHGLTLNAQENRPPYYALAFIMKL